MSVVERKSGGKPVYWIVFHQGGKPIWERVGPNRQQAERLESARRKQVKRGDSVIKTMTKGSSLARWLAHWKAVRATRNAKRDLSLLQRWVETRKWLTSTSLGNLRRRHSQRLADELLAACPSPKTALNAYTIYRAAVRDAGLAELVTNAPDVVRLPKDFFAHAPTLRGVYSTQDIAAICRAERGALIARVWATIAFFTGMRQGEVCGLRWGDWDESTPGLGCFTVARQYQDGLLKTEKVRGTRTRSVPVHPVLARVLVEWREAFAVMYRHAALPGDPLVPNETGGVQTSPGSYKYWRRLITHAGVTNRTLHSTRHTFISRCEDAGVDSRLLERITHNAKGSTLKRYTHPDWARLCEVVLAMWPADVDPRPRGVGSPETPSDSGLLGGPVGGGMLAKALESRPEAVGSNPPAPTRLASDFHGLEPAYGNRLRSSQSGAANDPLTWRDVCPECGSNDLRPCLSPEREEAFVCGRCRGRGAA